MRVGGNDVVSEGTGADVCNLEMSAQTGRVEVECVTARQKTKVDRLSNIL